MEKHKLIPNHHFGSDKHTTQNRYTELSKE